jgi:hypothetical protein
MESNLVQVNGAAGGIVPVENAAALAGFESNAADVGQLANQVGAVAGVAREEAEVKAAIVLARKFPRNEAAAYTKILRSCDRPGFADGAAYRFPRGGQTVTGPSVDLARELARCWGNIRYGLRIVSADEEQVHIKGYAYDLETNNYTEAEDKFAKLVQRKNRNTGRAEWVAPDERDLRELVNRRGAICVRNAILQLMPPDVIDDALERATETLRKAAAGEFTQNREQAVRRMAAAFSEFGVTTAMLEAKLGHSLAEMSPEEMASLRQMYASIRDGQSKREDYFEVQTTATAEGSSRAAQTLSKIKGDTPEADSGAKLEELRAKAAEVAKTTEPTTSTTATHHHPHPRPGLQPERAPHPARGVSP